MRSTGPRKLPQVFDFPPDQVTPAVLMLLEICHYQQEQIQELRDEIARLKGQKPKPKIKPSKLEGGGKKRRSKRPRRGKRSKTCNLEIHEIVVVPPKEIPKGSRFKGYEDFTVQDIRIELHNTRYRLERWEASTGEHLVGTLPADVGGVHFGATLRSFILYQYHHGHVTQPLILEQVREWGIDISAGHLSAIITDDKEGFHAEKEALLRVGLQQSSYVHVDDTGARHQGRNGYCTHIGNELFAWFASTQSKSRINFLELMRAGHEDYVLNEEALEYMHMHTQKLPKDLLAKLAAHDQKVSNNKEGWEGTLGELGITAERHVRIATEGALLGSVFKHGVHPDLVIVSDDAGQFNVLRHALCWIHAERAFAKLVGFNDGQREALAGVRTAIWDLYAELKSYKADPDDKKKAGLEARFDELCTTKTCFVTLNKALQRMHLNKTELLLVLERPDIPLHNNPSENDIREYVKKRKISGSTRSDEGRRCRDTFASLKKTCRKNGISFWEYLQDRLRGAGRIPPLATWIFEQTLPSVQTPSGLQSAGP
jgi:hypothetical protein